VAPFAILSAIIIGEKTWRKFMEFLGYFSIAISVLLIGILLFKPLPIFKRLNYQAYLLMQLPQSSAQKIYYVGEQHNFFALNWYFKDRVENLNSENFLEIANNSEQKKYVFSDLNSVADLPKKYQQQLHQIECVKKRSACIYELKSQ
jgi:hypothetical protein